VNEQLFPEGRLDGQLPMAPFAGALTAQGFGEQACSVRVPNEQVVAGPPTML
jgi:hypothetical protein